MANNPFTVTITRNSLAVQPKPTINAVAIIGTCTGLVPAAALPVYRQITGTNVATLGVGPLATAAQLLLAAGLSVVDVYACTATTETISTGTFLALSGTNTQLPTYTTSSKSIEDNGLLLIEIVTGGVVGTSTFRYSWDDGQTWAAPTQVTAATFVATLVRKPASGTAAAITTVGTVSFPSGTYTAGDRMGYMLFASPISTSNATIATAITAIQNSGRDYNFDVLANDNNVNVSGTDSANLTASYVDWQAMVTGVGTTLVAVGRYAQAVANIPRKVTLTSSKLVDELDTTWCNAVVAKYATLSDRAALGAGHVLVRSAGSYNVWAPACLLAVAREIQNANPKTSIYRTKDLNFSQVVQPGDLTVGGTKGCLQDYSGILQIGTTYDERVVGATSLNANGYLCLTTDIFGPEPKSSNLYFAGGNAHTSQTSDFFEWQRSVLMDVFIRVVMGALWSLKGSDFAARGDGTGRMTDEDARAIENMIQGDVKTTLVQPGFVYDMLPPMKFATVDNSNNFVSDSTIYVSAKMRAPGYAKYFTINFAYSL